MLKIKNSLNLALVGVLAISGCAVPSERIAAAYIAPVEYQSLNCQQLINEANKVRNKGIQLGARLDAAATNDAIIAVTGTLFFWPVLFSLGGMEDSQNYYATLRGEYSAIIQSASMKGCFPSQQGNRPY